MPAAETTPHPRFLIGVLAFCGVVVAVLANITFTAGGHTAPTLHPYLLVFLIAGGAALGALAVTLCLPGRVAAPLGTVGSHSTPGTAGRSLAQENV